jgi:hypothetical protein
VAVRARQLVAARPLAKHKVAALPANVHATK